MAFIDTLPVIAKQIQSGHSEFKIVDKLEEEYAFSLAVAKGNIVLLDIFNKLLASIELQELEYILNRWTPVFYEKHKDVSGLYCGDCTSFFTRYFIITCFIFLKNE